MEKQAFEYMSYHFIPVRQFNKKEDFFTVTRRLKSDLELGFFDDDYYGKGSRKAAYAYQDFYAAATDKECDIFQCLENGKLYAPCTHELQQYQEARINKRGDRDER